MTEEERPTAAFVLSLISGLLIILGGGMMSRFGYWLWSGYPGGYGGWGYGMMGPGMMGYPGFGMMGWMGFGFFGILGVVFGAIIIISAIMLNRNPREHATWGTLIVIFSVISIFGGAMGGFGIGLVLGLIGGVLAITWKPTETQTT
jgi:Family of unknown function (DUF6114)